MIKDCLKEKEPVLYTSLKNDLNNSKIAHCYLFFGEKSKLKTDTAFLLAQSIIENKNDFACESCETCKRIKDLKYYDVIYVDGYDSTVKKDDVENIMDEFSRTPLEKANKKVFIITNINNSSLKVLNMILKFIEEPTNDNTYAIFTTDNIDGLASTIVSRCEKLEFKTRDVKELIDEYKNAGFDNIDAYILANVKKVFEENLDLNDNKYLQAKEYVYKTIENLNNKKYIPVLFSREFYTAVKKEEFKETSDLYLKIMMLMLNDAIALNYCNDNDYDNHLKLLLDDNLSELFIIYSKAIDKTTISVNRQLLFDQIANEILSY